AYCRRDLGQLETDAIVVDGRLVDAIDLIRAIAAARPLMPTLFLSADVDDVMPAICAGAHDFALLTATPGEIGVRLHLLSSATPRPVRKQGRVGVLRVDRELRTVSAGDKSVSLSPIEFKMFEQLLANVGRAVSRGELERAIWGQAELAEHPTNIAVVYVSYLRKKLTQLSDVCSIATITNAGYTLNLEARSEKQSRSGHGPRGGR